MTAVVGVRCTDGVVIGADSAATSVADGRISTISQPYPKKIEIIGDRVIVAGSGEIGYLQRYSEVVANLWRNGQFSKKTAMEIGTLISGQSIKNFAETKLDTLPSDQAEYPLSGVAAYPTSDEHCLCEFTWAQFHPEIKERDGLWHVSTGSGQKTTDPFLAFLKSVFWRDGAPDIRGGIFTVLWALVHVCAVSPGGISEPIQIAVLEGRRRNTRARILSDDELIEHRNVVEDASEYLAKFKEVVLGETTIEAPPLRPGVPPKGV